MNFAFDITLKNRILLKSFLENFSLEQLNKVPEGFNNNIIFDGRQIYTCDISLA